MRRINLSLKLPIRLQVVKSDPLVKLEKEQTHRLRSLGVIWIGLIDPSSLRSCRDFARECFCFGRGGSDPPLARSRRALISPTNRWIRDHSGFISSFDASWSEWSWITDSDPGHAKGTHLQKTNKQSGVPFFEHLQRRRHLFWNREKLEKLGEENHSARLCWGKRLLVRVIGAGGWS